MIAIVKYNAGNATSVKHALSRLGAESVITDDKDIIRKADKVIFPGVGRASGAMRYLREKELNTCILDLRQPVLGICLGLQLMCAFTEEDDTHCLGIFNTCVKQFPPVHKVPHMGWNTVKNLPGPLFKDLPADSDMYFVHSYYAGICTNTIAACDYIVNFSAVLQKGNFYATQFHPEKSATVGARLLQNFLQL